MAEFCKQCSIALFGDDTKDLADLISEDDCEGGHGIAVICEGCGPTIVNWLGECISTDCLGHDHG